MPTASPLPPDEEHDAAQLLRAALRMPAAYADLAAAAKVEMLETHISLVFLAGDYAYKIKKPIKTHFLDYSTLALRQENCLKECELNRRYAPDLYLGVVPIVLNKSTHGPNDSRVCVSGPGAPIEYAVQMRRFPADALLSRRLEEGRVAMSDVRQLAETVAKFHERADRSDADRRWGSEPVLRAEAIENFTDLRGQLGSNIAPDLNEHLAWLEKWTTSRCEQLRPLLQSRPTQGFIRECHGDLHLANVIRWNDRWTPFDGIEFNDEFRWIDILSDAAFLAMDFSANGHRELCETFVSAYLEQTGDYRSIQLFRWYIVYRAMVRAKVAAIRSTQPGQEEVSRSDELQECVDHVLLARGLAAPRDPKIWITHGVSGSGKTTGSESVLQEHGAIRLRSDVERKRLFGLHPWERPKGAEMQKIYSPDATARTYQRLAKLTESLVTSGEAVIVDATFLKAAGRREFHAMAERLGIPFQILDFDAPLEKLKQRIIRRSSEGHDASDANLQVLELQRSVLEPLTAKEREFTIALGAGAT